MLIIIGLYFVVDLFDDEEVHPFDGAEIEVKKSDFKDPDNLVQCECGNWTHYSYVRDGGGCSSCPNCTIEFQHELIVKLKEAIPDSKVKEIYAEILNCSVEYLEDSGFFED